MSNITNKEKTLKDHKKKSFQYLQKAKKFIKPIRK
jgi:hypothetical protein